MNGKEILQKYVVKGHRRRIRKIPQAESRLLRMQRGMAALLDAPHGRRLGLGQRLPTDLRRIEDGAIGIRQAQLLRHLRSGRRRHDAISKGSRRRSHSDGHRLPHFDSEYPHTVSGIRERKDLTPKQKDKILGENAARLLNL
jgi:hypothetical protein